MRRSIALLAAALCMAVQPAAAQVIAYEPFGEDAGIEDAGWFEAGADFARGERFVAAAPVVTRAALPQGAAVYGPFRVLDAGRAALVDVTDERSPAAFAAMLRDHPGIAVLEMIDCPGTDEDRANLRLGRMIRERGIATHVPHGGSVRSGAVELFLAGAQRSAEPGASFAVHAWMDQDGLQPGDYAVTAPENRAYIDYYRAMGMSAQEAGAFYAMTNSVPHSSARWLTVAELGRWVRLDGVPGGREELPGNPVLVLASLDSGARLN